MNQEIPIRIILKNPPPGVDFGIQKGSGNKYETILKQSSKNKDLSFELKISINENKTPLPNFTILFVQGPKNEKFIYIDIGTYAGQLNLPIFGNFIERFRSNVKYIGISRKLF